MHSLYHTKKVRFAQISDKEQIMDLTQLSYGFSQGELRKLEQNYEISYQDHMVICDQDKILASLRNIPLQQNLRGIFKPMSGIAMVASSPEHRGQGNVHKLIGETFFSNYKNGIAVSTLYPFKDTYYAKFGYINATPHRFIEINPAWLSRWNALPKDYRLERIKLDQSSAQKAFMELHQHTIKQFHGGVKRPPKRWEEILQGNQNTAVLVYNSENEVEGFLSYFTTGYGFRLFDEHTIGSFQRVQFLYKSLAAKHALFYYIYQHRDQVHKVVLRLYPHDDAYYSWLQGFTKAHIRQHLQTMARIINLETAFADIPVSIPGSFAFTVSDPLAPWNTGTFSFHTTTSSNSSSSSSSVHLYLQVEKTSSEPDYTKPTFSIGALTGLLYGTSSISDLIYFKWIQRLSSEEEKLLANWFPRLPYCLSEFF
ncbi:MAG: hypothetical protein DRO88_10085 [Promethearchaeia archaeon]|nr:MAG: hypothetical protein DRO88_10085 [Candidatus Lokiarchaeia archaeon]